MCKGLFHDVCHVCIAIFLNRISQTDFQDPSQSDPDIYIYSYSYLFRYVWGSYKVMYERCYHLEGDHRHNTMTQEEFYNVLISCVNSSSFSCLGGD